MDSLAEALKKIAVLEARLAHLETVVFSLQHPPAFRQVVSTEPAPAYDFGKEATLGFPEIKLDVLDPKTEQLPPATPRKLDVKCALERYPHVLDKISLLWGHPECSLLLERLFVDDRGDRKGFDKEVIEEIILLSNLCGTSLGASLTSPTDKWSGARG